VLERSRVDLLHFHGVDFHHYLPAEGPPALVTLHLPIDWYVPEALRVRPWSTWYQCVSSSQARRAPPELPLVDFIPNGVPLDDLRLRERKRRFAVALGRICPEKGFHDAITAARDADIPLVIAGRVFPYPEHIAYFRDAIQPHLDGKRVRFIGVVGPARKRRLLGAASCLLVPSLAQETSSLVAMEALACGTPVVAYRAGALPDIVEHGRTGFLVDGVGPMAEAIDRVAAISPGECRRSAELRFSADVMVRRYLDLYQRLSARLVRAAVV
jgi:glycosyltransferase involved in cell wall biosynthesis